MITWIIGGILLVWLIIRRLMPGGKIEGLPLGLPRGTIRASITLLVVAFPLGYLLNGEEIPGLIINTIFVLVAFYFTSRRSKHEKLRRLIRDVKTPEEIITKEKKPLYLPKYSVRTLLILLIILILICNIFGSNVPFETTNTLYDLLSMISFFIAGAFFRGVLMFNEKKKTKAQIKSFDGYESMSEGEIVDKLLAQEQSWWKQRGYNILSILILIAVIISLFCYTINWDYVVLIFSFRDILLLLVSGYYGFRD